MSIHKLQHFLKASSEDFADAHEPVNDGVKPVPTAEDIAKQVGRSGGDGSADITKQGDANIVEEKPDDEDVTKTTPVEEKSPVIGEIPIPAKTEGESEAVVEDVVEDEPELAHEDVKAVEADEKVTAKEKESLEAFVPMIRRAELIGYSKRDVEALTKSIRTVRVKAGVKGAFTVSNESIHATIALADTHIQRLARKHKFLTQKASLELFSGVSEVVDTNQEPLAHTDAIPLAPAVGTVLTQQELVPIVDTIVEEQAMANVTGQIQQLEVAGVAVEQYVKLLRENKGRVSKQAAAVIQAGLEHIDATCGLRVRATGMESFDTTPRSAMESADVNEKSLMDRAGEIGAKILKWLKELYAIAERQWDKLSTGLTTLKNNAEILLDRIDNLKSSSSLDSIVIHPTTSAMYLGNDFVGDHITAEEFKVITDMHQGIKAVLNKGVGPAGAALAQANGDEILDELEKIVSTMAAGNNTELELPGGVKYSRTTMGLAIESKPDGNHPDKVEVDLGSRPELKKSIGEIMKYISALSDDGTMKLMRKVDETVTKGIVSYRKGQKGESFSEDTFQQVQSVMINSFIKPYSVETYLKVVRQLAQLAGVRLAILKRLVDSHESGKEKTQEE